MESAPPAVVGGVAIANCQFPIAIGFREPSRLMTVLQIEAIAVTVEAIIGDLIPCGSSEV